jgi:hypothetical protein
MKDLMNFVLARLAERSTWRGLVDVLAAAGLVLSPEQATTIITAGLGLRGLIATLFADKGKEVAP